MRAAWLRAVRRGHRRLARGLAVRCPVLVCTSDRSGPEGDVVLDVEQIEARAKQVGDDVTLAKIPGGVHDLALSPEPAREQYFATVFDWLSQKL